MRRYTDRVNLYKDLKRKKSKKIKEGKYDEGVDIGKQIKLLRTGTSVGGTA